MKISKPKDNTTFKLFLVLPIIIQLQIFMNFEKFDEFFKIVSRIRVCNIVIYIIPEIYKGAMSTFVVFRKD